ncbi:hypothetical protein TIFTF001_026714 [Ficus carica]|uniref:Reverse transcriptase zinc-binding domain-containing protein n=1 Tax=Ficus carica TaxID=3494 RepID=A0AA88DMM5_FICCA|nr:hypothetical protein TIFTF001_026714 [Ficus carica]
MMLSPLLLGLFRRKVIDSACSAACQSAWESVGHALIHCKFAKAIWRRSTITLKFGTIYHLPFKEIIHVLFTSFSTSEMELFLCLT